MLSLRQSEHFRASIYAAFRTYLTASKTQTKPKVAQSEYTEKPEYPQIRDLRPQARKEYERNQWYEDIRNVPTVEEKLIKINMPRYYGYRVVKLSDEDIPYNSLPAIQHYTRTIFENVKDELKHESTDNSNKSQSFDALIAAVKDDVKNAIEYSYDFFKHRHGNGSQLNAEEREKIFTQLVVEQLNRALIIGLSADVHALQEVEIDYNPRHEAFWLVGGINPPKNVIKSRDSLPWMKDRLHDPVDRLMQYLSSPYLTVRHRNQVTPWKSVEESNNPELAKEVPRYEYDPRTLGYKSTYQHGTNIPGFWPGSKSGFGFLSYQSRAFLQRRPKSFGVDDFKEAVHVQGIQSNYAWLLAQANYYGFNSVNDLTYPLNSLSIVTDGRCFSFYEYQLNTLLVHSKYVDENPQINFCRGTDELELYKEIDDNGKLVGFDDNVLRKLVQFYVNAPSVQRDDDELSPYLDKNVKRIADYENVEQREFLEKTFKHIASNKPRHLALPEVYLWERIYKIDNNTRPLEPKRRFFEFRVDPWKRTLDQHQKEYIPKAVRPEGPKSKKKWKPTYYP